MRILTAAEMLAEPDGAIYSEPDGNHAPPGPDGFMGYSDSLYRKGESGPNGWTKLMLLGQPSRTVTESRPQPRDPVAIRRCWSVRVVDEGDTDVFYVYDPDDVALLIALLNGHDPDPDA